MARQATAIGIDIGRSSIKTALVSSEGEILICRTTDLQEPRSRDYIVKTTATAIRDLRSEAAGMRYNPVCTGIAAKGFVNSSRGIIIGPDRGIKDWLSVPLARLLNHETSLPVYIGNDAHLMTHAEFRFGAARGYKNVLFISLRTGIGGGIIIDGKIYRGVNSTGAEFGQMIIDFTDNDYIEGTPGTLEKYASSQSLIERYHSAAAKEGIESYKVITAKDIFDLHYAGHKLATDLVLENASFVGIGVANLISLFSPEIIVLGGGMAQAGDDYIDEIRRVAFENSLEYCRSDVIITRAELGNSSSLIGAAIFALARLKGQIV